MCTLVRRLGTTPVHRSYHELTGQSPDELVEHVAMACRRLLADEAKKDVGKVVQGDSAIKDRVDLLETWKGRLTERDTLSNEHPASGRKDVSKGRRTTRASRAKRLFPGKEKDDI